MTTNSPIGLTPDGCRQRQARLRDALASLGADAALLLDPGHVMYVTGYWTRSLLARAAFVPADGPVVLVATGSPEGLGVDDVRSFEASRSSTLVDDQWASALSVLDDELAKTQRLAVDTLPRAGLLAERDATPLWDTMLSLRRPKDDDEVALLSHAVAATEAAYAYARDVLHEPTPTITEVELYARMQARAIETAGEPIGEFGNDFRSGSAGGPPRVRRVEVGELIPLDVTVTLRGYSCDLSRTFAVGGRPTDEQCAAQRLVAEALTHVETTVRPGASCRQLYERVFTMLDGQNGWRFGHHLGHGIGLFPHEAPRLNPHYDDAFAPGDVFTAEPGIYGQPLNAGVRIEQNYLVTEVGLERLSQFPIEL